MYACLYFFLLLECSKLRDTPLIFTGILGQQQQQQQQQQHPLQLGQLQQQQKPVGPGQLGPGGGMGLAGLGGTQQLGGGLGLKLPTSATTAGTGSTGLMGGSGLQLGGLQAGQTGLTLPKPTAAGAPTGLTGSLKLAQLPVQPKLPAQPGQTGLTGLSQAQVASTAAPGGLIIKPQTGLTGLTGAGT